MTILRTVEQRKVKNTCEKYLCNKDQCSPLRNSGGGFTHAHNVTCLPGRMQVIHFSLADCIQVS
jgi:hypothetical protein